MEEVLGPQALLSSAVEKTMTFKCFLMSCHTWLISMGTAV